MKKILFIYALLATAVAIAGLSRIGEVRRLKNNQQVLCGEITHYRTRANEAAASVIALQLRCDEFRKLRSEDAARIRSLGIKLRRLETLSSTAVETRAEVRTVIRDTVILYDTLRIFSWRDEWISIDGHIARDSVRCSVTSIDTLRQTVHRIPRRFLFIPYGTKALRQEIVSSNPHTKIVYAEYIELEKRRKRKK